jgi:hypothetical protein
VLNDYGYLLECHGRRELRRALELYERAIDLDPATTSRKFRVGRVEARKVESRRENGGGSGKLKSGSPQYVEEPR